MHFFTKFETPAYPSSSVKDVNTILTKPTIQLKYACLFRKKMQHVLKAQELTYVRKVLLHISKVSTAYPLSV